MAQVKGFMHQESQLGSSLPPQPPDPTACWPWSGVGSTVCSKLFFPQGVGTACHELQDLDMRSSGIKGSNKFGQPLLFLQRWHPYSEPLFCTRPASVQISSQWVLESTSKVETEFESVSYDTQSRTLPYYSRLDYF